MAEKNLLKSKLLILLPLLWTVTLSAQLTITPGAQFSVSSDTKLTLQNTDLIKREIYFYHSVFM